MIKNNQTFGISVAVCAFALAASAACSQTPVMTQSFTLSPNERPAYDAAKGQGYVSIANGNEVAFAVAAPPGDYRVTAAVGAGRTTLWAEDRRLVAGPIVVPAGQTREVSFIVNVRNAIMANAEQDATRAPRVGLRGDESGGRNWDDMLTISASGPDKALLALKLEPVQVRRVLLAGDSTVSDQAGSDFASWGQMLPRFVGGEVVVANHARGGETMKSFVTSLRWDKLLSETRAGDIVIIQFGHNDEKKQWQRTYLGADGAYGAYLAAFVAEVRQRGATPVLVTPVARRFFENGKIRNTHEGYDAAVRDTARMLGVPVIDLTALSTSFYEQLGPERSALAFGNRGQDKTHHNAYGAWAMACLAAGELKTLDLGLAIDAPDCAPEPEAFEISAADWPLMRTPEQPKQAAEPVP
ncbi:rhamnogalacturonan acetylesterase [Asticcacaulis biprosthecium C19]|uniref:Rhamnogalacturonan acetylesterase n=2 Tax=Asticcacaulis biprosthecium TaxID=76891 RepID=F4QHD8_9CAUL|nr:rhamnogalacturonan acetylesterase [Asticcacaulis biprosthecium C19]